MNVSTMSHAELVAALTAAQAALAARPVHAPAFARFAFWKNANMRDGKDDAQLAGELQLNIARVTPLLVAALAAGEETFTLWASLWNNVAEGEVDAGVGKTGKPLPLFSGNARNIKE